jgi:hypothetical protein
MLDCRRGHPAIACQTNQPPPINPAPRCHTPAAQPPHFCEPRGELTSGTGCNEHHAASCAVMDSNRAWWRNFDAEARRRGVSVDVCRDAAAEAMLELLECEPNVAAQELRRTARDAAAALLNRMAPPTIPDTRRHGQHQAPRWRLHGYMSSRHPGSRINQAAPEETR